MRANLKRKHRVLKLILQAELKEKRGLTHSEIARECRRYSKTAISDILDDLQAEGLVTKEEKYSDVHPGLFEYEVKRECKRRRLLRKYYKYQEYIQKSIRDYQKGHIVNKQFDNNNKFISFYYRIRQGTVLAIAQQGERCELGKAQRIGPVNDPLIRIGDCDYRLGELPNINYHIMKSADDRYMVDKEKWFEMITKQKRLPDQRIDPHRGLGVIARIYQKWRVKLGKARIAYVLTQEGLSRLEHILTEEELHMMTSNGKN